MATFGIPKTQTESIDRTQEYLSPIDVEIGLWANLRWALSQFENGNPEFNSILQELQDTITQNIDITTINDVDTFWLYIYLPWENNYVVDIIKLLHWETDFLEEWVSLEEVSWRAIETATIYRENVLELEVMLDSIHECLIRNDDEFWENIGAEDIIASWPLEWLTLIEAILRFRKLIWESEELSVVLNLFPWESSIDIGEENSKLFAMQEAYLLLAMWIGEEKEELIEVIPKSKGEIDRLLEWVVSKKSIEEVFEFMRDIHRQIDNNDSQTANVEENYTYFIDRLNELVFSKISKEVTEPIFWDPSPHFNNPQILLDFASFVSGRTGWYDQSLSRWEMDSRYRRPEMATRALALAMTIRREIDWEEQASMNDHMMPYLDIQDKALNGKSPWEVIAWFKTYVLLNVSQIDENGDTAWFSDEKFQEIISDLGYKDIFDAYSSWKLWNYDSLGLEDKITIWAIARIFNTFAQEKNSWGKEISEQVFFEVIGTASQESIKHIWSELDRNFDDGKWERFAEATVPFANMWLHESEEDRAKQFWIPINSIEYEIFTLYNDIQWNWNHLEISDWNRDHLMTAWYMLAMVAGSMALWWGLIFAATRAWIAINSLVAQGTIYGLSGSAMWYTLDAGLWDTRWFYSPTEAITSVWSDFLLWGITWAFWWVIANKFWNPGAKFLSKQNIPNQAIFAWDITANGIVPEMARLYAMDMIWKNSEIFTENETPIIWNIYSQRLAILKNMASEDQLSLYVKDPKSSKLSPYLQWYRIIPELFLHYGFESKKVSLEFDTRFQNAYAIWKMLNPWAWVSPWYANEDFNTAIRMQDDGIEWIRARILKWLEKWVVQQESRITKIL